MRNNQKRTAPFRAVLGRDIRLFLRGLPTALPLALLLALVSALAANALGHGADSGYTAAPLAIVDEDASFTSTLAISMISHQSFAAPLDIVKAKADVAEGGLADGTFCAVLYLPKNYADDILVGETTAARLVVSENAPLYGDVLRLLCSFGEELLSTGQLGIFSGERLVLQAAPDRHAAYLKHANTRFLTQAMADPEITRQQLSYGLTGVTPGNWYLLMYGMVFFHLLILGCFFAARDCTPDVLRRLKAEGVPDSAFLAPKVLILFVFYGLLAAAMLAAAGYRITLPGAGALALALLTAVCVGLALILRLPRNHAVTAVTALAAVGLLASGGMIPRMELPRVVTTLGDFLPLGACARMAAPVLGGSIAPLYGAVCLLWTALSWLVMGRALGAARKGAVE